MSVELPDAEQLEALARERARAKPDPATRHLEQLGQELKSRMDELAARQGPVLLTDGLTPDQIDRLRKAKTPQEQLDVLVRAAMAPGQPSPEEQIARGVKAGVAEVLTRLGVELPPELAAELGGQPKPAPAERERKAASYVAPPVPPPEAEAEFVAYVQQNAAAYPLLAALPPAVQSARAWHLATSAAKLAALQLERGEPVTYDPYSITLAQLASGVERSLSKGAASGHPQAPTGAPAPVSTGGTPQAPTGAPPAPGLPQAAPSGTTTPPSVTSSVTAAHASEVSRRAPTDPWEVIRDGADFMRQLQRAEAQSA